MNNTDWTKEIGFGKKINEIIKETGFGKKTNEMIKEIGFGEKTNEVIKDTGITQIARRLTKEEMVEIQTHAAVGKIKEKGCEVISYGVKQGEGSITYKDDVNRYTASIKVVQDGIVNMNTSFPTDVPSETMKQRIKELRLKHTQKEVAEMVGKSQTFISLVENGKI